MNKNTNTDFYDTFEGKGTVKKELIDKRTGKVVDTIVDHNLIVKTGRNTLIKMLAGEKATSVNKMAVGSGGTADLGANAFNPIAPIDGDASLKIPIAGGNGLVTVSSRTVDTTTQNPKVTFVALFDCAIVNSLVNECGLIFEDGTTMFARHTFDTVSLRINSNFSLQISWTIEF